MNDFDKSAAEPHEAAPAVTLTMDMNVAELARAADKIVMRVPKAWKDRLVVLCELSDGDKIEILKPFAGGVDVSVTVERTVDPPPDPG
jgi:hypothetical protein